MKLREEMLFTFKQTEEMKLYGMNNLIKEYANFPKYLPGGFYSEHGWSPNEGAAFPTLETKQELFLTFSKRREIAWKKVRDIPAVNVGSPFVHFRKRNKIGIKKNAKGTLALPVHSGTIRTSEFDYERYADNLLSLHEDFHPITICLHYDDIKRGRDQRFEKSNFQIVSAGDRHDNCFPINFYHILSRHKYATSNGVGSHVFYAVEMGLPFFILGDEPVIINHDKSIEVVAPEKQFISKTPFGSMCYELFNTGPSKIITSKQQTFVEQELGLHDCISPKALNRLLWKTFFRYGLYKYAKKAVRKFIKVAFAKNHHV